MKAIIISDLHFHPWITGSIPVAGERTGFKGPSRMIEQFETLAWLNEYISDNQINYVFFLGDLFHSRKSIDAQCLYYAGKILSLFKDVKFIFVAGNHDITGNFNIYLEPIVELLGFTLIRKPTIMKIGNITIALNPWNYQELQEGDIFMGHVEVKDIWLNNYVKERKGINKGDLKSKYKLSFLGHYHNHYQDENIITVGSLFRLTRADKGIKKGFILLDIEKLSFEFIPVEVWDFPDIIIEKSKKEENKIVNIRENIMSFEQALTIYLDKKGHKELIKKALEYWNEVIS